MSQPSLNARFFLTNDQITITMWKMLSIKNPTPSTDNTSQIPTAKNPAGTIFLVRPGQIAVAGEDFPPIGDIKTCSWRTVLLNGTFKRGSWKVWGFLEMLTKDEVTVSVTCRLSKSVNSDGSSGIEILTATSSDILVLDLGTSQISIDVDILDDTDLVNEYLFAEFKINIVVPTNAADAMLAFWCDRGGAEPGDSQKEMVQPGAWISNWKSNKNPTAYEAFPGYPEWVDPQDALVEDAVYASAIGSEQEVYKTYKHDVVPSGADIVQVIVDLIHREETASEFLHVLVSPDGGVSWGFEIILPNSPLWGTVHNLDMSLDQTWTKDMLSDANFRVRVLRSEAGCLHPETEVALFEQELTTKLNKMKKAKDIKVGDLLLAWENGNFVLAKVTKVRNEKGNFRFVKLITRYPNEFWCKELRKHFKLDKMLNGYKDIIVTDNHPMWECKQAKNILAGKLKKGDALGGLFIDKIVNGKPILKIKPTLIKEIQYFYGKEAIHIETTAKNMFGHFQLQVFIKW